LTASIRLVVADTGPLNYLVLTGDIWLLPRLFDRVLAPQAVRDELANPEAPAAVRAWIAQAPAWLEVQPNPDISRNNLAAPKLDDGERAVIALALAAKADLVLMDDQDGVTAARRQGLTVTGTLGVLDLAARRGLIDLAAAFERLKATTFYYRQGLLDGLLAQYRKGNDE
jgi:predicted nucleic acid-binding protein